MEPFSYHLPSDRIAQRPCSPADDAKMLVVNRASGEISISQFAYLPEFLDPGDLLVLNDTRVIPARLFGTLSGRPVEVLLVREETEGMWRVLGRPMKQLRRGGEIECGELLRGRIEVTKDDDIRCSFYTIDGSSVTNALAHFGSMPIPPYIRGGKGDLQDRADYQTIFARDDFAAGVGSVAAPTASLHFTDRLFARCERRGIRWAFLTLHVGTASFLPVYRPGANEPQLPGCEWFEMPIPTRDAIKETKRAGGRVVAVGTTVARALESVAREPERLRGETTLFITPGFEWRMATNLVTNFHQPGTSHLLLVESLLGRQLLGAVYASALADGFRFLSYGDGMVVL
jgi:S-adenosylmethionine:tRNA ribosyltransferase-isomerase